MKVVCNTILIFTEQEIDIEGETELLARCQNIAQLPTRDMLYTNGCAGYVKHLDMLKGEYRYVLLYSY